MGIITLGLVLKNTQTGFVGTIIAVLYELHKSIQLTIKEGREEEWVSGTKYKLLYVFANQTEHWELFDVPVSLKKGKRKG